jgi:HlyD family secretion protein
MPRHAGFFASAQVARYEQLLLSRTASEDTAEAKRQEAQVAEAGLALAVANLESAEQDLVRVRAEREALVQQRANLRLIAPVDALVVSRDAEPGSTVVAGQSVVEVIDPSRLWIDARFDQLGAGALRADLLGPDRAALAAAGHLAGRGAADRAAGRRRHRGVSRQDRLFDAARAAAPTRRAGRGDRGPGAAEPAPALPNAALHRRDGRLGVWVLDDAGPRFARSSPGA